MARKNSKPRFGASAGAGKRKTSDIEKRGKTRKRGAGKGQPVKSAEKPKTSSKSDGLVVVGIGASAGGLEALFELLEHLPERIGMAFVLVQHLDPNHQSLLSEVLGRKSKLPVAQATEGTTVEPNKFYVIPPNRNMTFEGGALRLAQRTLHRGQHMPIDIFLRSLAVERRNRAVAIILSGGNTDGALGVEAIKAEGGIVLVQEPSSTKHPDMPAAAMATGCVDLVLSPAQIAKELSRIDGHPYIRTNAAEGDREVGAKRPAAPEPRVRPQGTPADSAAGGARHLRRILTILRNALGVDFSLYKPATVLRRVQRRMALLRIDSTVDYARVLQNNQPEILALHHDILINVTSFFRDPAMFQFLRKHVFPEVFRGRGKSELVRIWVPGCSTGEEPYSIAIVLAEYLGRRRGDFPVQIFATDLSEIALDRAREGTYIENIALDVSSERLRRFFVRTGKSYKISKPIREMVVFARQNLAKDPPFSPLDMISCRNVLIYLGPNLQRKVFPTFHYALRPGGYLILGHSESVGEFTDLFTPLDKKVKVFVRQNNTSRLRLSTGLLAEMKFPQLSIPEGISWSARAARSEGEEEQSLIDLEREASRLLAQRYVPPGMLVTQDLDVLHFFGHRHEFVQPAEGKASLNLHKILKEGLALHVRAAVLAARRQGSGLQKNVYYSDENRTIGVDLEVTPFRQAPGELQYFLVVLREAPERQAEETVVRAEGKRTRATQGKTNERGELERLRHELIATRQYLQNIVEEQDDSNEEIRSANEEILSSNEELQSTNEELETAKEELQSSNEELITVNEELQNGNLELALANNDLSNLLDSVNLAIVMVGADCRIRRFTSTAARLFNLIPSDAGRPFSDIKTNLKTSDLIEMVEDVLSNVGSKEQDVRDQEGRWYRLSIRPYLTPDNKLDGAVITVIDIDPLRKSLEELKGSRDFAEAIVAGMTEPLLVLEGGLLIRSASPGFYEVFQLTPSAIVGKPLATIGGREWADEHLQNLLVEVLERGSRLDRYPVERQFATVGRKRLLLRARQIASDDEEKAFVLLTLEDITERRQIEREILTISDREQQRIAQDLHDGLGQQLTAVGFLAQGLINRIKPQETPGLAEDGKTLLLQVNKAIGIMHDLAHGLHPMQLEPANFKTAMQTMTSNVENLFKIACAFHAFEPFREPKDKQEATHLYRIAQEAINNALKHGKATHLAIDYRFERETGTTLLAIHDDGKGMENIPRRGSETGGMGLQIMRYRADAIRGNLRIESGSGGTTITVTLPAEKEDSGSF